MMLVHLPGHRLLYTSDEVIPTTPDGKTFFMPSFLVEVQMAMRREAIDSVATIFGMHLGPTPWSEVEAAIAALRRGTTEKPQR